MRLVLKTAVLIMVSGVAAAADLDRPAKVGRELTLSPTRPVGLASEFPRSPLADDFVNGVVRYARASDAQAHCPHDVVVRVETWSNVYRPATAPGQGAFMCQADALSEGDGPQGRSGQD